jgi:hypothetical protein
MDTPPPNGPVFIVALSSIAVLVAILVIVATMLSSCQYLPQVADDIEKIANNDAIIVKVDKDAFQKDTDVDVSVSVKNKDISK